MKIGKVVTNAIIIALLVTILMTLLKGQNSGYSGAAVATAPITISSGLAVKTQPKDLFAIKPSLDCTPGPSEDASYYTSGLTPGGICGDQQYVHEMMRDFAIADGIGGSLLEK
jgi:hypothetical protein